jgi:hypothetical protein
MGIGDSTTPGGRRSAAAAPPLHTNSKLQLRVRNGEAAHVVCRKHGDVREAVLKDCTKTRNSSSHKTKPALSRRRRRESSDNHNQYYCYYRIANRKNYSACCETSRLKSPSENGRSGLHKGSCQLLRAQTLRRPSRAVLLPSLVVAAAAVMRRTVCLRASAPSRCTAVA